MANLLGEEPWWKKKLLMPSIIPPMDFSLQGNTLTTDLTPLVTASIPDTPSLLNSAYVALQSAIQLRVERATQIKDNVNNLLSSTPMDLQLNVSAVGNGANTPELVAAGDNGSPAVLTQINGDEEESSSSFKDKLAGIGNNPSILKAVLAGSQAVNTISRLAGADNYDGPKGHITEAIDGGWNAISDAAMLLPGPWGKVAGTAMKAVGALNNLLSAITGGTDGMTNTDAVLDSPLGFLTGVGWINQAFGLTADTITKDEEAFDLVGSSYGGTGNTVDEALEKSGKKYGAFSGKARHEANREIAEAKRQLSLMSGIALDAERKRAIQASMSAINGNRRMFQMQGGYNQAAIHAAKYGMRFERAKNIIKNYNTPKTEPVIEEFKDGGTLDLFVIQEPPEDYQLPEEVVAFQKGGSFNIIPEGALHARKHNIDLEGITKKGIPVISESEGGEILQQAEIELAEIIMRLEVTQKLEELAKINEDSDKTLKEKDEAAIEAGKLLVEEILHNTEDKVQALINE